MNAIRRRNDRRFLITSAAVGAAFLAWAALAELDVVSMASGEVIPATRVKAVQHLEGGIVNQILVDEGTVVSRGQPLIRLDPIRAEAEVAELGKRLLNLRIDIVRMTAEAAGDAKLTLPPALEHEAPDLATAAHDLFTTHQRRIAHEIKTQNALVDQRRSELRELTLRLGNNQKYNELLSSQVSISANLLHGDLTSRMAHLELLRQQQNVRTQIDADRSSQPRVEAALNEAQERLGTVRESFLEQARRDLAAATQSLTELSQRELKFRNIQERTILRAPVDGIIKTLAVTTEGGIIQPGQTVVEIVPLDDRLVIEAQLPVQDIGYVRPGQDVRITLQTPDANAFGHIDGTVRVVSPDAIVVGGKYAFYKVRIETGQKRFEAGQRVYGLYPGMRVMCGIRIGTRTVLTYLLSPWLHALRFAFQER
jgi:adhesin transport system membrane fusion protein